MKKIIPTIFALLISVMAMAQMPEQRNPVLNFQVAGLSFPVENEQSTIEANDQSITFGQFVNGEGDPNLLNNINSFKIRNDNYMVTAYIIRYSPEEFENMSESFVSYLMEHMNDSVPNSRTLQYTINPDQNEINLTHSSLMYSGFFKNEGVVDETVYMSYNFVYLRTLGYMVVMEIFGNPQYADYINSYASRCVNLDKDFVTGEYLSHAELASADDGVDFIQKLLLKMQKYSKERLFKIKTDDTIAGAYYTYKQMFGTNAPSYNGQDKSLSKEEKNYIQKTVENRKMEAYVIKQKQELEQMGAELNSRPKDVKTVKKK
ncbi:MAG: hypothetical protein MJZ41_08055 [Bacteroidaceae bacterium]|nr:hypothetical protein [Bacteroidaceae bacterium]